MVVLVQVQDYIDTHYDGSILVDEETFRVERKFPWQKWSLLDEYGIGYEPGDEWDGFPIRPNQKYQVEFSDGYKDIQTTVIG